MLVMALNECEKIKNRPSAITPDKNEKQYNIVTPGSIYNIHMFFRFKFLVIFLNLCN